jgi:hypothetical protein
VIILSHFFGKVQIWKTIIHRSIIILRRWTKYKKQMLRLEFIWMLQVRLLEQAKMKE